MNNTTATYQQTEADRYRAEATTAREVPATTWAGIEVAALYPGCTTTWAVHHDGRVLATLTQTPDSPTALVKFTDTRGFYRFATRTDGVAAALCHAARGYWYGEI